MATNWLNNSPFLSRNRDKSTSSVNWLLLMISCRRDYRSTIALRGSWCRILSHLGVASWPIDWNISKRTFLNNWPYKWWCLVLLLVSPLLVIHAAYKLLLPTLWRVLLPWKPYLSILWHSIAIALIFAYWFVLHHINIGWHSWNKVILWCLDLLLGCSMMWSWSLINLLVKTWMLGAIRIWVVDRSQRELAPGILLFLKH